MSDKPKLFAVEYYLDDVYSGSQTNDSTYLSYQMMYPSFLGYNGNFYFIGDKDSYGVCASIISISLITFTAKPPDREWSIRKDLDEVVEVEFK